MQNQVVSKPRVMHIQRKKRKGSNFSLEFIFKDVRKRLKGQFDLQLHSVKRESNGVVNRIMNIFEVGFLRGDLFHITGDIHYVTYLLKRSKTVLTILDCGFMNQENKIKRRVLKNLWLDLPVWKSKYITTISEASKQDILRYSNCDPEKIFVIPVAVDEIYKPNPKEFNTYYPVLLHIGTAPNKNLERLIPAIKDIDCKLVIVGNLSSVYIDLLKQFDIDYENRVNLTQHEMYQAYCACDIVTFVSTFEGFGMPIIEANCVERVVIAGNNSSMPEVGADAACYVDAFSIENIREGMVKILSQKAYRDALIANGKVNRVRFANEHIALQYAEVYNKLLS